MAAVRAHVRQPVCCGDAGDHVDYDSLEQRANVHSRFDAGEAQRVCGVRIRTGDDGVPAWDRGVGGNRADSAADRGDVGRPGRGVCTLAGAQPEAHRTDLFAGKEKRLKAGRGKLLRFFFFCCVDL